MNGVVLIAVVFYLLHYIYATAKYIYNPIYMDAAEKSRYPLLHYLHNQSE